MGVPSPTETLQLTTKVVNWGGGGKLNTVDPFQNMHRSSLVCTSPPPNNFTRSTCDCLREKTGTSKKGIVQEFQDGGKDRANQKGGKRKGTTSI